METSYSIPIETKYISTVVTKPAHSTSWSNYAVILTHGAGGDINVEDIKAITDKLSHAGFIVVRFNSKTPNFQYRLKCFRTVVDFVRNEIPVRGCIVGGRSMGGRVAAELVTSDPDAGIFILGVACISYPLHKPKQYTEQRISHLIHLKMPVLMISGTDDQMCRVDLMEKIIEKMNCDVKIHWIQSADHSLKIKGKIPENVLQDMCMWFLHWCQSVFMAERS